MAYKHDYDKILTRLVTILSKLNDGEALSVKELAEEFNTSPRTIQRDFNERLISFPIYQDGKKWKMQKGFRLEKSTSIQEKVVLDIMEGLVDSDNSLFSKKAKQLLSKLKNTEQNPIYTRLDMEDISHHITEFHLLELAIKNRHKITCNYHFENFEKSVLLKPLRVVNYEGFWYLLALEDEGEKLKKYYLKNISSIKTTSEHFSASSSLEETLDNARSIWFDQDITPFKVRLHISAQVAKYFMRRPLSKSQKIDKTYDDGSLEISIMITHHMEITPLVKYWLPQIKVLEPQEIKKQIAEDIKGYLDCYESVY